MRVAVAVSCLLVAFAATADARPSKQHKRDKGKRVAIETDVKQRGDRDRDRDRGQSIGMPWRGRLASPTRLRLGDGAHIRRPHRAFGTRTTVEYVRRAINETLDQFPRSHVLAVGDLSQREGGWITEHHSHQSGRDIDIGLFFKKRPAGYPASFVPATEDNLDRAANWALLTNLLSTQDEDGGVHMIFLDFEVQGMLYEWARDHGVSERRLERIFQYPHGRGASAGIVRHEPHHDDHFHVRYRCARADRQCQR